MGSQGLLLDCDAATLTVWVNGERKGVMVRPGMTDRDGQLWHADAVSDWDGMPEEDELAPYTWLEEGDVVVRLTLALTRRTQASRACAWRRA